MWLIQAYERFQFGGRTPRATSLAAWTFCASRPICCSPSPPFRGVNGLFTDQTAVAGPGSFGGLEDAGLDMADPAPVSGGGIRASSWFQPKFPSG